MSKKTKLIVLILSIMMSALASIPIRVQALPYDVTIRAWCYAEAGSVSVAITKDSTPTGFYTPYTFAGLTGSHTFTVPGSDGGAHTFTRWNNESYTTTTITTTETSNNATNVAYYSSYYVYTRARDTSETWSQTLRPGAAGTYQQWSVSGPSHWGATSDQNDATYIYSSTSKANDTQNVQDLSALGDDWVASVVVYARSKASGGSGADETMSTFLRTYSTNYVGSATTLNRTAFTNTYAVYDKNPKTGKGWTATEVNNLEAGVMVQSIGGGEQVQVSEIWVVVEIAKSVSVAITKDGSPSGFNTPHNFTQLTGSDSFTVPAYDTPYYNPVADVIWAETGGSSMTYVADVTWETLTAQYRAYTIAAQYTNGTAIDGAVSNVKVSRYVSPGVYDTYYVPKTFNGVYGSQTFNVSDGTSDGKPFKNWAPPLETVTSPTVTVERGRTYTAIYGGYDVTIKAYSRTLSSYVNVTVRKDDDLTLYYTNDANGKKFSDLVGIHTFTIAAIDNVTVLTPRPGNPFAGWDNGVSSLSISVLPWSAVKDFTAYYEAITIDAFCLTEGKRVTVPIYRNGTFVANTKTTFTGLIPPWNFTVPLLDSKGHPFQWWNASIPNPSTTITVALGGNYTATYLLKSLVYVEPSIIQGTRGQTVDAYVKIQNLTDGWIWNPVTRFYEPLGNLYALRAKLSWDPMLLQYERCSVRIPVESYPDGVLHSPVTYGATLAGEAKVTSAVVSGSYVYAGLNMTPGKVVKIDTADMYPIAGLRLESGENYANALASDGTYLYVGLATAPAKIVRISLTTFARVDTLTLDAGENCITSFAANATHLFAGCYTSPGKVVTVKLSTFARTGVMTFAAGENYVKALASDGTNLYAGCYTVAGKIIKITIATFTKVGSTLQLSAGENYITSFAANATHLFAGCYTSPNGKVVAVKLATFLRTGVVTFGANEINVNGLAVVGSYLYAALYMAPIRIIRINLGTFTKSGNSLTLSAGENYANLLIVSGNYLYTGTNTDLAKVLRTDSTLWPSSTTLPFTSGDNSVTSLASDGTYLYAGLYLSPGKIYKIRLSDFTIVGSPLSLASGENIITCLASDGTYLYAGLYVSTGVAGKIAKISLATFTEVGTALTLASGENDLRALVISGSHLYAALGTSPGKVAKINLATFTEVGTALTLGTGENTASSLAVSGSYLYAGLQMNPGKIVKINLGTFAEVANLTLPTGETDVKALAISGDYLYAGLTTSPSQIVKVYLGDFSRVTSIVFVTGEIALYALAISGTNLYAGLSTSPGRIIKIDLDTFSRLAALVLPTNDNAIRSLAIVGTNLYAGLYMSPGKVTEVDLTTYPSTAGPTLAKSCDVVGQSVINVATLKWPYPFNDGSVITPPTIFKVTFKILKSNTPIPLNLSDIMLQVPPIGWEDPVTGEQKFNRMDISNFIGYTKAFDYYDLKAMQAAYGSTSLKPNWNIDCDFNRDNVISVIDLQMLGKYFGKRS